jgi:hypothetical protein
MEELDCSSDCKDYCECACSDCKCCSSCTDTCACPASENDLDSKLAALLSLHSVEYRFSNLSPVVVSLFPRIAKAVTSAYTAMDEEDERSSDDEDSGSEEEEVGEEERPTLPLGEDEDWDEMFDHPA